MQAFLCKNPCVGLIRWSERVFGCVSCTHSVFGELSTGVVLALVLPTSMCVLYLAR